MVVAKSGRDFPRSGDRQPAGNLNVAARTRGDSSTINATNRVCGLIVWGRVKERGEDTIADVAKEVHQDDKEGGEYIA